MSWKIGLVWRKKMISFVTLDKAILSRFCQFITSPWKKKDDSETNFLLWNAKWIVRVLPFESRTHKLSRNVGACLVAGAYC